MTADNKKEFNFENLRSKIKSNQNRSQDDNVGRSSGVFGADGHITKDESNFSWRAVSQATAKDDGRSSFLNSIDFVGKNLENGKFANENLENASFSVSNLTGVDFSGANLRGVDFSGANLTDADLSGADLSGAVLSGSVLVRTNFTGAKLNGVKLTEAYLEDAIMLGIEIDELGIEELQQLIEYMAKYYPHKLNLAKLNLTLLDLKKIDLTKVSLRGVDFTGVDFTGINIMELDLSECIITPQQIAQAIGHVPNKEELAKIMAPKKKKAKGFEGVDVTELFLDDGRELGILDFTKDKGISIETLMKVTKLDRILKTGKKVYRDAEKPEPKDVEALKNIQSEHDQKVKTHNAELIEIIKERKRAELEARAAMKQELQQEISKEKQPEVKEAPKKEIKEPQFINIRDQRGRD